MRAVNTLLFLGSLTDNKQQMPYSGHSILNSVCTPSKDLRGTKDSKMYNRVQKQSWNSHSTEEKAASWQCLLNPGFQQNADDGGVTMWVPGNHIFNMVGDSCHQ